jgi:Calcineurin-like phosphoesterase
MKILITGDLHEKLDILELAIEKFKTEGYDKIVFMSDFCDSFIHSDTRMIQCLNLAIEFKKEYPDKVVLLWANHELQYRYYPNYRCSGFNSSCQLVVQQLLTENSQLWQYYYYQSGFLFTHAGITNGWLKQVKETFKYYDSNDSLFELLDKLEQTQQGLDLLNQCGSSRGGHRYDKGGLTWCDKSELIADAYYDDLIKNQVVGHTAVPEITKVDNLYFTDCLGKTVEFLTLDL